MGRSLFLGLVAHHRLREQPCGKPGLGLACAGGELAELVDDPGFDAEAVELLDDGWFGFHGGQCGGRLGARQTTVFRARIFAMRRRGDCGRLRHQVRVTGRRSTLRSRPRAIRCGAISWSTPWPVIRGTCGGWMPGSRRGPTTSWAA